MEFDRLTVSLLIARPDWRPIDQASDTAEQDAHLSHLADLHQSGELLAVGPVLGPPGDYRGLGIYRSDTERARAIGEEDPAVRAGRFSQLAMPWLIPAGAIGFSTSRVPRSVAEARSKIEFDRLTVALLIKGPNFDQLENDDGGLQDAHMAHLADLHEAGHLVAAGPLLDQTYRGLSLLRVEPARALELKTQDAAVRAGRYRVEAYPWLVPIGAMTFSRTRFPRSMAETANP